MNYHEKIKRYSRLYKKGLGRIIFIEHNRYRKPGSKIHKLNMPKETIRHIHGRGKIIRIDKASLKILVNDEQIITIGFRTIRNSLYLDSSSKIKASLYYGIGKHKSKLKC